MIYQLPTSAALQKRCDDTTSRFYQLLSVFDPAAEMDAEQLTKVQSVFISVVDAMVFHRVPLEREPILSCLLGKQSPILARTFTSLLSFAECKLLTESCISNADLPSECSAEINYSEVLGCASIAVLNVSPGRKQVELTDYPDDLLPVIVALMSEPNRSVAWQHLFLRCCKYRRHLIDLILVSRPVSAFYE